MVQSHRRVILASDGILDQRWWVAVRGLPLSASNNRIVSEVEGRTTYPGATRTPAPHIESVKSMLSAVSANSANQSSSSPTGSLSVEPESSTGNTSDRDMFIRPSFAGGISSKTWPVRYAWRSSATFAKLATTVEYWTEQPFAVVSMSPTAKPNAKSRGRPRMLQVDSKLCSQYQAE